MRELRLSTDVLTDPSGESAAIAAHRVLNASAIVRTGIEAVDESWDTLSASERAELIDRLRTNAKAIDDCLRGLIHHEIQL